MCCCILSRVSYTAEVISSETESIGDIALYVNKDLMELPMLITPACSCNCTSLPASSNAKCWPAFITILQFSAFQIPSDIDMTSVILCTRHHLLPKSNTWTWSILVCRPWKNSISEQFGWWFLFRNQIMTACLVLVWLVARTLALTWDLSHNLTWDKHPV